MMIPDNGRREALFKHAYEDGTTWTEQRPVVAWSESGDALVVHRDALEVACNLPDFKGIVEAESPVVGIASAGGWRIERRCEDGAIWDAPIVGWAIRADGQVSALETDATGEAEEVGRSIWSKGEYVIYHPDETPQAHRLNAQGSSTENGTTP